MSNLQRKGRAFPHIGAAKPLGAWNFFTAPGVGVRGGEGSRSLFGLWGTKSVVTIFRNPQ